MEKFTQLGLSGKQENKVASVLNREERKRFVGTQIVALFATALIGTSLAGLFLFESGCSQESKHENIQSPIAQSSSTPSMGYSTAAITPATPQVGAEPKKKAPKKPPTVAYNDAASGVSFEYPKRYVLKTPDATKKEAVDQVEFAMNFVRPGGVTIASVELPKGTYKGTDLASASFNVSVNKNVSEEECGQFSLLQSDASGRPAIVPTRVKVAGMKFQEFEAVEGPDTQQADAKYFHTYQNGACYEFALGLETDLNNAADDDVKPIDRTAVFHRLQLLLSSVKINTPETPVVAATAPSVPDTSTASAQPTAAPVAQADGAHQ